MKLLSYLLTLALGVSLAFDYIAADELFASNARIEKLETDVRTYSGRVLDLQETMEDNIAEARSQLSVELWNLQNQLETCKKNAPTPRS